MFRLVACASAALASATGVGYQQYVDQYAAGGFGAGSPVEAPDLLAMDHQGKANSSDKDAPSGGGSAGGDFSKYIPGGGGAASGGGDFMKKYMGGGGGGDFMKKYMSSGGGGDFMKKFMPGGGSSNSSAGGLDFGKFMKQFGPGSFGGGKNDSIDDQGALKKIETAPASAESCHNMSCLQDWKDATDGMVNKFGANSAEGKSFWNKFVQGKFAGNKARIEEEETNRSLAANRSLAENSTAKNASEPKANSSSGKEARRDESAKGESRASLAAAPEGLAAAVGDSDVVHPPSARGLVLAALAAVAAGILARAWRGTQLQELEGSDSADYYQIAA